MGQQERDAHEKWVREAEYITEVCNERPGSQPPKLCVLGKLAGSRHAYEIHLVSENPERWRVFTKSFAAKAVEINHHFDGNTPRECLERVVALDNASPDAG